MAVPAHADAELPRRVAQEQIDGFLDPLRHLGRRPECQGDVGHLAQEHEHGVGGAGERAVDDPVGVPERPGVPAVPAAGVQGASHAVAVNRVPALAVTAAVTEIGQAEVLRGLDDVVEVIDARFEYLDQLVFRADAVIGKEDGTGCELAVPGPAAPGAGARPGQVREELLVPGWRLSGHGAVPPSPPVPAGRSHW